MRAAKGRSFDDPGCPGRRRLTRTLASIALLGGLTAVTPGCGAPENLAQVADELQTALTSMPGVSDAWVYHEESYAEGVAVNIAVDVSAATREQVAAVADRIDATRIGFIANYAQNVEFWVTPNRAVTVQRHSHLDAAQIADDTERVRQIAAGTDGRIDWFRSDDGTVNSLSFDQTHSSGTAILDAVRDAAGGSGLSVSVSPVAPTRQSPRILADFPLDPAQQSAVFSVVNTVPGDVLGLRLDGRGLQALEVVAPDPATAEQDLSAVISASEPVAARPMWLAWYYPTFAGAAPGYGGVVSLTGCGAAAAGQVQTVAQRTGDPTPTLQSRLQAKLDSCGAPPAAASQPGPAQSAPPGTPAQGAQTTPVIDVVAPDRVRDTTRPTGVPTPSPFAEAPCVAGSVRAAAAGSTCAATTTVANTAGGSQAGGGTTPVRPVVVTPPLPTDLPVPLPAAGGPPGSGSGSGSGSGTGSGSGSDSSAQHASTGPRSGRGTH